MRPAGEVHLAMLKAAHAIKRERMASGTGATLREVAARACVGYKVARSTMSNLRRYGHMSIVGECKVAGRNRPAALYLPTTPEADLLAVDAAPVDAGPLLIQNALLSWAR